MINWVVLPFSELTTMQLYQLLQLRVDVFVVEQNCPYSELDGKDIKEGVHHLLGYQQDELVACARLLPQGVSFDNVSIGRVVTKESARGQGLGHELIQEALRRCQQLWPNQAIDIGAQEHLANYYAGYGFTPISESYLEDGILHIDMRREATA